MSKGNDADQIVPSVPNNLSKRSSGLVRRGLQDLAVSAPKVRKRILVADDQEAINEVVGAALSSAGYEVRTTTHPSEVISLVDDFRPQVALIGLVAPEIDGVKLSQKLSTRFPNLKIVLTGEEVEEGILRHLLDDGVACDTLEVPFELKDMLDMVETWVSGSDYVDPVTRLRDARHFRMGLLGNIGAKNFKSLGLVNHSRPSVIFIELFEPTSIHTTLENESSFLRSLGAAVARFAQDGFAYRYGQNQFAMLLPHVDKVEACELSKQFSTEVKSLLKNHKLSDRYLAAIGVVSLPDDVQSVEQVREAGRQLIAKAKETGMGGIAVWGVGLVEPAMKDVLTGLYTEGFFLEALSAEWKRSERHKRVFSLVDVQVADFEALSESRSRQVINQFLAEMGQKIETTCRRSDVPCHYRSGEFLILLPETSKENACSMALLLHRVLKEATSLVTGLQSPHLTVGVTTYPADGKTVPDLIHSLDEAMLVVKNSTRDGVAAANKGILTPL